MKKSRFLILLVVLTFCSLFTFFGCETTDNADLNNNVLNNKMLRDNDYYDPGIITSVTFLDTLANAPEDAWDFSEAQNGCVLAWLAGTHLYVAGEGGVKAGADASYMFAEWGKTEVTANSWSYSFNLEEIDFGLNCFDTSGVTNMQGMFKMCSAVQRLDLRSFNTSNVTDMSAMFESCAVHSLDLSSFDTTQVRDMQRMFADGYNLSRIYLDSFDTSNVINMQSMFSLCRHLISLDLNSFDTSNVTDMGNMFSRCEKLAVLNLNNFDTSKVIDMHRMFSYCSSLPTLDLSNFDTSNVITMWEMFADCLSLKELDLSSFNMENVADMNDMFRNTKWENNPSAVLP